MEKSENSFSRAKLQASPDGYERFKRDRFGLSFHFGLYSIGGDKEWSQALLKLPREQYAERMNHFHPDAFDAHEWASLAKKAGCSALMLTTKHHDGFCLFDSDFTGFTSANSPFRRDIVRELADACHKAGMSVHLYFSLLDWNHPLGMDCEFRTAGNWDGFCQFMLNQIQELCTGYGQVDGLLLDGWWPGSKASSNQTRTKERGDWPLTGIYDLVHKLQPGCMITNNHHILPLPGEDYQVWELDMPGENSQGFNCTEIGDKPLMAWFTASEEGLWSWSPKARYRSPDSVRSLLDKAKSSGASLFLNIGPMGNGDLTTQEKNLLCALQA